MLDGSGLTFDKGKINFLVNIYLISSHLNSISRAIVSQSLESHPRLCRSLCAWILPESLFILLTWSFGTGPLSTGTPRTRTKPSLQTKKDHLLERRRQSQPVQGLKPVEESSVRLHHLDLHPKKGGILSLLSSFIICSLFFVFDNFNETCVKSAVGILSASSDPQSSWGVDTCQKNLIKTLCVCNL